MAGPARIFISSVQKELAEERRALKDFVHNDALLRQHFEVFLFEDLPARDQRADAAYLDEVERCAIYVGVFGMVYENTGTDGISPTEREFDHATALGRERLIYVKGSTDTGRDPRMAALLRKAGEQLVRRRFGTVPELTVALYASALSPERFGGVRPDRPPATHRHHPHTALRCGRLPTRHAGRSGPRKVVAFLRKAQANRGYALGPETPMPEVLAHLNLLDNGQPSHAAVLLFGRAPQRFLMSSEVKCIRRTADAGGQAHARLQDLQGHRVRTGRSGGGFHVEQDPLKPACLQAGVGTRAESVTAPVTHQVPKEVVTEAIVNAVAHRDYASGASVQVMLFSDRLEVWNPGAFPPNLVGVDLSAPSP